MDRLDERLVYLFVEGVWKTEKDWKGLKWVMKEFKKKGKKQEEKMKIIMKMLEMKEKITIL